MIENKCKQWDGIPISIPMVDVPEFMGWATGSVGVSTSKQFSTIGGLELKEFGGCGGKTDVESGFVR